MSLSPNLYQSTAVKRNDQTVGVSQFRTQFEKKV